MLEMIKPTQYPQADYADADFMSCGADIKKLAKLYLFDLHSGKRKIVRVF